MGTSTFRKESQTANNNVKNFAAFPVEGQTCVGFTVKVSGSGFTLAVKIQVSCNGSDWADSTVTSASKTGINAAGTYEVHIEHCSFPQVRLVATESGSQDASCEVLGYAKE